VVKLKIIILFVK